MSKLVATAKGLGGTVREAAKVHMLSLALLFPHLSR